MHAAAQEATPATQPAATHSSSPARKQAMTLAISERIPGGNSDEAVVVVPPSATTGGAGRTGGSLKSSPPPLKGARALRPVLTPAPHPIRSYPSAPTPAPPEHHEHHTCPSPGPGCTAPGHVLLLGHGPRLSEAPPRAATTVSTWLAGSGTTLRCPLAAPAGSAPSTAAASGPMWAPTACVATS